MLNIIAPAGFWPRRHPRVPRMYTITYKEFQESKKCVGSMGSFLDLMKLGAHGGLGLWCQLHVIRSGLANTLQLHHGLRYDFSVVK